MFSAAWQYTSVYIITASKVSNTRIIGNAVPQMQNGRDMVGFSYEGTTLNLYPLALKSELAKMQGGQVTGITLAANSQTEVTVTLKHAFASGTDYVAVASVEYYSNPQLLSAVIIRSKAFNSFVCRIYNSSSNSETDVKLNWVVMPV